MQVQKMPENPAIENMLLKAMNKLGYITDEECDQPYTFYFQRAARTDRAVSAVRQVCSMMMPAADFKENGVEKLNALLPHDIRVMGIRRVVKKFHAQKDCDSRSYSYSLPTFAFAKLNELSQEDFRITRETIADVDSILELYVGTHNFFNYTSKKEHNDASCKRYIISFKCGEPFLCKNEETGKECEFITINIRGQSFMLHQIRKMIGMTIAIARGYTYRSDITRSFESQRMDVPKAPGLGLLLEQVHYAQYDKRWSKTHETVDTWGDEIEAKIKKIKDELIVKEIVNTEMKTLSMFNWLQNLPSHNYTVNPESDEKTPPSQIAYAAHTANMELEKQKEEETMEGELKEAKEEEPKGAEEETAAVPEKVTAQA
ncbi:hypothetical protein L596_006806 [Steinernema carpocapsae]|uniref:Pseudouridine synthase I TruA alpha/beta domain-containing protein n=1 Tax=Steinernema carpocapsae TaxID=34508 RepID=A0A4U5P7M5_STECR|nr:hypothetical protein L596_006806 [Steinernema carpocapsae]